MAVLKISRDFYVSVFVPKTASSGQRGRLRLLKYFVYVVSYKVWPCFKIKNRNVW
jgi:hypothetical protein